MRKRKTRIGRGERQNTENTERKWISKWKMIHKTSKRRYEIEGKRRGWEKNMKLKNISRDERNIRLI